MLALVAQSAAGPTLSLQTPSIVTSGEEVVATVWAENKTEKPIVMVLPSAPNNVLGLSWKDSLTKDGKPIVRDERGPFMGQWMVAHEIGKDPFLTLKPGERVQLYQEKFTVYLTQGKKPSELSEYGKAPRAPLPAGTYTLKFRYGFQRDFDKRTTGRPNRFASSQKLTQEGRWLYNQAWTGTVDLASEFTVKAKS